MADQTPTDLIDDIDSKIYRLAEANYPHKTETTSELAVGSPGIKLEDGPQKKRQRRSRHEPEPEYSSIVRQDQERKKETSDRSRHACDRCKLRKTRCTIGENGPACFLCLQDGLECFVTDRVTNETFPRGEPGRMKRKIAELEEHIAAIGREKEVSDLENIHLRAMLSHLEAENISLQEENLRREGRRAFADSWVSGLNVGWHFLVRVEADSHNIAYSSLMGLLDPTYNVCFALVLILASWVCFVRIQIEIF
ncbi:hypothetical protein N7454_006247 [Penicillium verhagenii]|nr:hypothetical protein N7454_006247 [Penicillium verhagenii]